MGVDVSEGSWVVVALVSAGVPESSITGVGVKVGSVAAVRVGVLGLTSPNVGKGEFVGLDSGDAVGSFSFPSSDCGVEVDVCVSRGSTPARAVFTGPARLDSNTAAITKP